MSDPVSQPPPSDSIERLVSFRGAPADFWGAFFEYVSGPCEGRAGLVVTRNAGGEWTVSVAWPFAGPEAEAGPREAMRRAAAESADAVAAQGALARELRVEGFRGGGTLLGVRLPMGDGDAPALLFLKSAARWLPAESANLLRWLRAVGAAAAAYQERLRSDQAEAAAARFGAVLDLWAALRAEKRFIGAAMRLCNEVAGRYGCDRVALGWSRGEYVRLQAVSHAERFEKRMEAVRRIETAMEEAFDQDEEILWPPAEENGPVCREHEALAREQGAQHLVSIPLRRDGKPVGVLLCERAAPFTETELGHLRLIADRTADALADLHDRDRWFGARWWAALLRQWRRLAEPRHIGAKLLAVAGAVALALFLFLPVPFRVQTPFVVRAKAAVYLPAPFDGFIAEVLTEPGDRVAQGQPLLRMDTRELLLEEAAAIAERERYLRESEKARAENALAALRIAQAQAEQARVRLELTRHRLAQAVLAAPFDGVVIEGDLRERVGAPVRQGDSLLRVAKLSDLDVEIEVDQRDAHEVRPGAAVRLAFAGRPALRVDAVIETVEPLAQTRERRNVFPARCRLVAPPADWMRPGMTGLGKVEAGWRPLAWIVTRRTADFLRLHLWW